MLRAAASGIAISVLAGSAPFAVLLDLNRRVCPDWPWAAFVNLLWLALAACWLSGWGWPRSTRDVRRFNLRLLRPTALSAETIVEAVAVGALIVAIYGIFIAASAGQPPPDLTPYPTTALRMSGLIMGALLSGVGEEMAFRGYMQSQLEGFGPGFAITVTSIIFMLAHAPQDLAQFAHLAIGYFMLAMLWGALAYRTGSILPGMTLHVLGDLSVAYFVVLGGHGELLFAPTPHP